MSRKKKDFRNENVAPSSIELNSDGSRYVPGAQIGRGGVGRIRLAEDQALYRTVAMKLLIDSTSRRGRVTQARFVREALVLARLEHPNIVPIYDFGKRSDGKFFYTMKLVKGETLHAILRNLRDHPEDEALQQEYSLGRLLLVFRKVCDAIAFAHEQGVIHRDLKPENIMLGRFGEAMVMDWGLAKLCRENASTALTPLPEEFTELDPIELAPDTEDTADIEDPEDRWRHELTMDGSVVGTPMYMSPEQARGDLEEIDERSDVYALGTILYSMLTYHPPIKGKNTFEVVRKVARGEIQDPQRCAEHEVSGALAAVAMRALATNPDRRYQSVAEVLADLDAYEGGFATSAENIGVIGQLLLLIRRHRFFAASVAVILLISMAFVGKLVDSERRAHESAESATREALAAQQAEGEAREAAATAARAESAARVAEEDARQAEERATRALGNANLALAEAAWMAGDAARLRTLLESVPERQRASNWRYLQEKLDCQVARLPEFATPPIYWPGNAKEAAAFVARVNKQLSLFNCDDGKLRRKLSFPGSVFTISPDGKRVAAIDKKAVIVGDFPNHNQRRIEFPLELQMVEFSASGTGIFAKSGGRRDLYFAEIANGERHWTLSGREAGGSGIG